MSPTPPDPVPAETDRRKKLIGRLVVIGLGLLIAVYLLPMFLSLMR